MKVYRNEIRHRPGGGIPVLLKHIICEIDEATYTGQDMGERQITATIQSPIIIDFKIGDYIELQIADLRGEWAVEKFYIYTIPTIKKNASSDSARDAFEISVVFYPAQYELQTVKMRDIIGQTAAQDITAQSMLYTGYDTFSFYGGAHLLLDRIKYVLDERFNNGITWKYVLSDTIDEYINPSLESFQFDFSDNNVYEALQKLSDEEGLNIEWFINDRTIYVGFPKPHIVGFDVDGRLLQTPFIFEYGKTSHLPITHNKGDLFTITKSAGSTLPITRLYAYGSERNVNRFYCSDVIQSGRYVSKLMLPSFSRDGKTDYIESKSGIAKYGIREGSKQFEDIFPTLKYVSYADLRQIKYVIKIMGNGEDVDILDPTPSNYLSDSVTFPVARVQCYKIIENSNGVNTLQEAYPPKKLSVFVHATGKTVKCTLCTTASEQRAADYRVPMRNGVQIQGACFCVHDDGYYDPDGTLGEHTRRPDWFVKSEDSTVTKRQINYTDDFWVTDVFVFDKYSYDAGETPYFNRDGYSAYCYPRLNNNYQYYGGDTQPVNEIVDIEPIYTPDTDISMAEGTGQATFDIYLRDTGFKINEQNQFGSNVFVINGNFKVNFYDGYLAGLDFDVAAVNGNEMCDSVVPLYLTDGTLNPEFTEGATDSTLAQRAISEGAFWRIRCKRNTDNEYSWLPNMIINAKPGDHVIFLDIFMPDIYIRAAENRLQREAEIYLEDNSKGDSQYSLEFDKVRLAQIQQLGLQMREGALMRIFDSDLGLYTQNENKVIADYGEDGRSYINKMVISNIDVTTAVQPRYVADRISIYNDEFKATINLNINPLEQHSINTRQKICDFHATTDKNHIQLCFYVFYAVTTALNSDHSTDYFIARILLQSEQQTIEIATFSSNAYEGDYRDIYGNTSFSDDNVWIHVVEVFTGAMTNLAVGDYTVYLEVELSNSELIGGYSKINYNDGIGGEYSENDSYTYGVPTSYNGVPCDLEFISDTKYRMTLLLQGSNALYTTKPINNITYYSTRNTKKTMAVSDVVIETNGVYEQGYWKYVMTFKINTSDLELEEMKKNLYYWLVSYNYQYTIAAGTTVKAGAGVPIICRTAEQYRFRRGKYYEVAFKVSNAEMIAHDEDGIRQQFTLLQNISRGSTYTPDYTVNIDDDIYTYSFYLPTSFNDGANYYPALTYIADGETENILITLLSITERNTEVKGENASYIDLTIDQITINLTDNVQDVGLGGYQDSVFRDISATVKERKKSTTWNILSGAINNNTIAQSKQNNKINILSRKISKL